MVLARRARNRSRSDASGPFETVEFIALVIIASSPILPALAEQNSTTPTAVPTVASRFGDPAQVGPPADELHASDAQDLIAKLALLSESISSWEIKPTPEIVRRLMRYQPMVCGETDLALIGKIDSIRSYRVQKPYGRSVDSVTFVQVETNIFGVLSDWLEMTVPGGHLDGTWYKVGDYPVMKEEQRYLLLVDEMSDGQVRIIAGGRGAFQLDTDADLPPSAVLREIWTEYCNASQVDPNVIPIDGVPPQQSGHGSRPEVQPAVN